MSFDVLTTKLHPPSVHTRLIERPELSQRFARGLELPLTLVSAPAGSGKTTLVAQWLAGSDHRVAWLSLDEQDSEPSRFLTYLVSAIRTVAPVGESVLKTLGADSASIDTALRSFLNELADLGEDVILVLDDYHEIESVEVDQALALLIGHLPARAKVVLISREDPPLPLARMRARAQLSEIRATDLRFSRDEAGDFLRNAMDIDLSDSEIASLENRTEGWIAGLQLAAVSLQNESDVSGFVDSFSASNRFVLDYLLEEVLNREANAVQEFLINTSVLDRFCVPLCETVLGNPELCAEEMLRHIEQSNLFLIPLDHDRRWYRYHHLFAELLRGRVEDPATLHNRASLWYEENGYQLDAYLHASEAANTGRALDLVYAGEVPLYFAGHVRPVLRWIESIPEPDRDANPELWVHYGWVLWTAHRSNAAQAALDRIENRGLALSRRATGLAAALGAMLAANTYHTDTIKENATRALELLDDSDSYVRTSVLRTLAVAYHYAGDCAAARDTYQSVIARCEQSGNVFLSILTTTGLAILEESVLNLRTAEKLHNQVLDAVGQPTQPVACASWLGLARIAYLRNDLAAAHERAEKGIELAEVIEGIDVPVEGAVLLARIALAAGRSREARQILRDAKDRAQRSNYHVQLLAISKLQAEDASSTGNADVARKLIEGQEAPLTLARIELADGRAQAALGVLRRCRTAAEAGEFTHELARASVLESAALWATDRQNEACELIAAVLTRVAAEESLRTVADEGKAIVPLLKECVTRGVEPRFATRVLALVDSAEVHPDPGPVGVLSRRELEVLRFIASGLSNQEIGDKLFVSLSTVKGHTARIYEKLEVNRRTEAVARAQELGLL